MIEGKDKTSCSQELSKSSTFHYQSVISTAGKEAVKKHLSQHKEPTLVSLGGFPLNKNYSIIADLSTWSIVVVLHCVESTATVYQSHAVVTWGKGGGHSLVRGWEVRG